LSQVSEVKRRNQDIRELLSRLRFVDSSILPPLKPQDLYEDDYDETELEVGEHEGEGESEQVAYDALPDVYDSPLIPAKTQPRTASPLILDDADDEQFEDTPQTPPRTPPVPQSKNSQ